MHIKNGLFHVYGHSNNSPLTYLIRRTYRVEIKAGVKERNGDRSSETVFLTLKTFRGSGMQLITWFSKIDIYFLSLSSVEAPWKPSLHKSWAPKNSSAKLCPWSTWIHFPILPWEPNVFLLQSTNFPVSFNMCHLTSSMAATAHDSSQSCHFHKLTSTAFLQNYSEQCPLDIKGCSEFQRFKFTEDGFNNPLAYCTERRQQYVVKWHWASIINYLLMI